MKKIIGIIGTLIVLLLLCLPQFAAALNADDIGGCDSDNDGDGPACVYYTPPPPPKGTADNSGADHNDPPDKCPNCGDPINLITGAEIHRITDMVVKGPADITVERIYSSQSRYDSPLGYAWAFEHDRQVLPFSDGSVVIRHGAGWRAEYKLNNGLLEGKSTGLLVGELVSDAGGGYTFTHRDGRRDIYDAEGRLIKAVSTTGHWLAYTYDTTTKYALTRTTTTEGVTGTAKAVAYYHRLTRIESYFADGSASGRYVDFTYSPTTGRLLTVKAVDGREVSYVHDTADKGKLETVNGLEGRVSTYLYNAPVALKNEYLITSIQEGAGETPYTNTYDSQWRVTNQKHGLSELQISYQTDRTDVTTKVYNGSGTLLNQELISYTFGANGLPLDHLDGNKNKRTDERNAQGQLTKSTYYRNVGTIASPQYQLDRTEEYTYDAEGRLTEKKTTGSDGQRVTATMTYDHRRVLTRELSSTVQVGRIFRTEYEYNHDAAGLPTTLWKVKRKRDDGSFAVTTRLYDAKHRLTEIIHPDGHKQKIAYENGSIEPTLIYHEINGQQVSYDRQRFTYDARGNITAEFDGGENMTGYHYDGLHRLREKTTPDGFSTLYAYQGDRLISIESGHTATTTGLTTTLGYDALGYINSITRTPSGGTATTVWSFINDTEGNQLSATDAMGNTWSYGYDAEGNLSSTTDPQGNTWHYGYDYFGNKIWSVDPKGFEERFEYDGSGNLIKHDQLALTTLTTRYSYDAIGNPLTVTDPKGQTFTYEYDALGRKLRFVRPAGDAISYAYDIRGRLDYTISANGRKIDYGYAEWGGLTTLDYYSSAGATSYDKRITFGHDAVGNISTVTDPELIDGRPAYTYVYDSLNRPQSIAAAYLPGNERRIVYGYDSLGKVDTTTFQYKQNAQWIDERVQQNRHNGLGELETLLVNGNERLGYGYRPDGRLLKITHSAGLTATYDYNANGTLKWVKWQSGKGTEDQLAYLYDEVNNIRQITALGDKEQRYRYDELSRLTRAEFDPALGLNNELYSYDQASNREAPLDTDYYDYSANNELIKAGSITYTHDAAGNRIGGSDGSTYVYNHDNQLVRYTKGNTSAEYLYDFFGRRVRKIVTVGSAAPQITWYQWDGDSLAAELDAAGNSVKRYTYDEHSHNPVQMEDAGGIYDIHQDHLGTPRLVTDQQQRVVWRADYRAFGQAVVDEDPDGDGVTMTLNVRFPGQWYDGESGLHYNYFRDYDPGAGRYIQSDPIGLAGGLNTYAYVDANPLIYTDPEGLSVRGRIPGVPTPVPNSTGSTSSGSGSTGRGDASSVRGYRGRELGRGRWTCIVRCNVYVIDDCAECPKRVVGIGHGHSEAEAKVNGEHAANWNVPQGCGKRHCKPRKCWKGRPPRDIERYLRVD